MTYICIENLKKELERTYDSTRVVLVHYTSNKEVDPDHIRLESIRYNIYTDQVQVAIHANIDSYYQDLIQKTESNLENSYERELESKDQQIQALVGLLRAYQRKEKGTANKASELLDSKYRNVG
jgi:LmbE family N-acetylglucosaminyl deacetylase